MIYNDSWLISYTLRRFFVIVVMRGTVCREHRRCVHQRPKVSFSGKARGKLMGFTENWWALCMCSCEIRVHRTTFFFSLARACSSLPFIVAHPPVAPFYLPVPYNRAWRFFPRTFATCAVFHLRRALQKLDVTSKFIGFFPRECIERKMRRTSFQARDERFVNISIRSLMRLYVCVRAI